MEIPIVFDSSVPEGVALLIPPDVKDAMDLAGAAEVMRRHGIISDEILGMVAHAAEETIELAGKEKRIASIKNLT